MSRTTKPKILALAMVLILVLGIGAIMIAAQDTTGTLITTLNVRVGPDTEHPAITQLPDGTEVVIEARNNIGNWILIHTADQSVRGWVASRYVAFGGDEVLNTLLLERKLL